MSVMDKFLNYMKLNDEDDGGYYDDDYYDDDDEVAEPAPRRSKPTLVKDIEPEPEEEKPVKKTVPKIFNL